MAAHVALRTVAAYLRQHGQPELGGALQGDSGFRTDVVVYDTS